MAAVLEARAVISAVDETGPAFAQLREKLAGIDKQIAAVDRASKNVGAIGRNIDSASAAVSRAMEAHRALVAEGERVMAASAKLAEFKEGQKGFAQARLRFNEAQAAVKALAAEIASADAPTKKLERDYERARTAVAAAAHEFAAQKEALLGLKAEFEGLDGPLTSIASAEDRLASAAQRTSEALERQGAAAQRAQATAARRAAWRQQFADILPLAGPALLHETHRAFEAGAELSHENLQLLMAGVPPDVTAAYNARAIELSARYPNVSAGAIIGMAKETRSVMTKPGEELQILEDLVKARAVLDAIDRSGEAGDSLGFLVKGAEDIGAAKNPERLRKLIDGYVKSIQVMGRTITPEKIFEFDKATRGAGAHLSDRFLMTTGLSMVQEMGESAGVGIASFARQVAGGFANSHGALKEFVRLGLINKGDVDWLKTGEAKGLKPGRTPHGWNRH